MNVEEQDVYKKLLDNEITEDKVKALKYLRDELEKNEDITTFRKNLQKLLCDKNRNIRWETAEMLTQLEKKKNSYRQTYDSITKHLRDGTNQEKLNAAIWLIDVTIPTMLSDRDERNIEGAMPMLIAGLFEDDLDVEMKCLEAISSAQHDDQDIDDAYPSLLAILLERPEKQRILAALIFRDSIVRDIDLTDFIPSFYCYLSDPLEKVKWAISDALTYYHAVKENYKEVEKLLFHRDKDIRQEAAGTLAQGYRIKIQNLLPALKKLLGDESKEVALVAAKTIVGAAQDIEDIKPTLNIIAKQIKDEKEEVKIYSAKIIATAIGKYARKYDTLVKLNNNDPEAVWKSIQPIILVLETVLTEKVEKVRFYVASALIDYYLRVKLPENILKVLDKVDEKLYYELVIRLEDQLDLVPESVYSHIVEKSNRNLKKKFVELIKNSAKELNLSAREFSQVKLLELPSEIGLAKSLTRLDLSQNCLKTLPKEIGNLVNLRTLIVSNNRLEKLPDEIGNLKSLEELYLYRNNLTELPKSIGRLSNLRYLQLIQNNLVSLPKEFGNLSSLKYLELEENHLEALPKEFANLNNLQSLTLSSNKLSELPPELERLQNLDQFNLNLNNMTEIPDFVYKLKNLRSFSFGQNKLKEVPPKIKQIPSLESLYLRGNLLQSLPSEIAQLSKLNYLDLSHNKLTSLPLEFINLKLRYLDLVGNNLKIPDSIILYHNSPSKILKHYFKEKSS